MAAKTERDQFIQSQQELPPAETSTTRSRKEERLQTDLSRLFYPTCAVDLSCLASFQAVSLHLSSCVQSLRHG